jgi:hypothetical protein
MARAVPGGISRDLGTVVKQSLHCQRSWLPRVRSNTHPALCSRFTRSRYLIDFTLLIYRLDKIKSSS